MTAAGRYQRPFSPLTRTVPMSLSVFLWARRFRSCYPRAAVNRSPNRIANWFMATFQSKVALTDLASTLRSASHRSLTAASSVGKWPRVLMILRSCMFKLSMALVV